MNRRQFIRTTAGGTAFFLAGRRVYAIGESPALRKFIQRLPGAGPSGIPVAPPDVSTYPGSDYYRLVMGEYTQQLHPDLPRATKLWGYADATNSAPVFRHLGPLVVAQRDRPVRMTFTVSAIGVLAAALLATLMMRDGRRTAEKTADREPELAA